MRVKILNIYVDQTSKEEIARKVKSYLNNNHKFYIVTPNPEIALMSYRDERLAKIINDADISVPDGVGLKLADSRLKIIKGRQLLDDLIKLADKYRLKIFLLGGIPDSNKSAVAMVSKHYSNIKVSGLPGPNLNLDGKAITKEDLDSEESVVAIINKLKPDLLFVAFGAPKQELWIARNLSKLEIGGVMAIGGSIDYLSGFAKLPPKLIERIGFEWLWRVVCEPWRFGRIINAVGVFPATLILAGIKKIVYHK